MKTPSGLIRIPGLIGTISKYLKTNMTSGEMLEYALSARKIVDNRDLSTVNSDRI